MSGRDRAREELAARRFDLLVVGGGILGAGIAREAARNGLGVALVERGDFGSATSSASSKLVHGGLRYLRLGDVRLVREAHAERRALMHVVAPHLVRRIPFLMPLYDGGPYRPATIQVALWLYATLARERPAGLLAPERARRSVPSLRTERLRSCGVYSDAWTHDTRLCLANVRGAADLGATVLNYAEVMALRTVSGRVAGAEVRDVLDGGHLSVDARTVVNATGPWVDRVRRLADGRCGPSTTLSKGVHVLLPLEEGWSAALSVPHDRVRVSFAIPWLGMLLLGTTDELYDGDLDRVGATESDIRRVLDEAGVALDSSLLRRERVLSAFAGLRVLPQAGRDTASARRETLLLPGPPGLLSVAGGKLTTYRRIALDVLRALRAELGLHRIDGRPAPLPGGEDLQAATTRLARQFPELEPQVRAHLACLYGSLAEEVLADAERDPELLRPLHPAAPDVAAQIGYAREREWACTNDDLLLRRTTLGLRGLSVPELESLSR
jgi:glycerol-3-phosphate dehydrogenase